MNTNPGGANIKGQEKAMLDYMRNHKGVTRLTATNILRIANPPEIVRRLRVRGYRIESEWNKRTNAYGETKRYTKYFLIETGETEHV